MAASRRSKDSVAAGGLSLPDRITPMLAESVAEPFDSADHAFEIKWDGTRCIAFIETGRVRLQNRRFADLTQRYPELAGLSKLPAGTVLDGEIVVLDGGRPSFSKLMQRDHLTDAARIAAVARRLPATFMVFDVLYAAGKPVMELALADRQKLLSRIMGDLNDPHVVLTDSIAEQGKAYFEAARQAGLEGVIAKRLDSPYLPGKRTTYWLKIKVSRVEAFEILGFVQREKQPFISALILGTRTGKKWVYKGNVGTGFTEADRQAWLARLANLPKLPDPPKDGPPDAQWRSTGLRCRVRFFEETEDGKLRGPVFEGLEE